MITLIALIVLCFIGLLIKKFSTYYGLFGEVICFVSIPFVIINLIALDNKQTEYNRTLSRATSMQMTLDGARESGLNAETTGVVKDVMEFNSYLAELQALNDHWFYDQYIDDRIDTIPFVK